MEHSGIKLRDLRTKYCPGALIVEEVSRRVYKASVTRIELVDTESGLMLVIHLKHTITPNDSMKWDERDIRTCTIPLDGCVSNKVGHGGLSFTYEKDGATMTALLLPPGIDTHKMSSTTWKF